MLRRLLWWSAVIVNGLLLLFMSVASAALIFTDSPLSPLELGIPSALVLAPMLAVPALLLGPRRAVGPGASVFD